jgi:hypothetical protein
MQWIQLRTTLTVSHTLAFLAFCLLVRHAEAQDIYRAALLRAVVAKEQALDSNLTADWEQALLRFKQADAIQGTVESKYEIGVAAARLGYDDVAVEAYEHALELGLAGTAQAKARSFVSTHASQMARLIIRGSDGTEVFVEGVERARLPLARPIVVLAGSTVLEAVTETDEHITRNLSLTAGQVETVQLASSISGLPAIPSVLDATPNPILPKNLKAPLGNNGPESQSRQSSQIAWRRTGWILLGEGATVSLISLVLVPISGKKIDDGRRALAKVCAVQVNGPDSCAHAMTGLQGEAQSDSDSIATWKAVRTGSWVGIGTGVVAAMTGVAILILSDRTREVPKLPNVSLGPHNLEVLYQARF